MISREDWLKFWDALDYIVSTSHEDSTLRLHVHLFAQGVLAWGQVTALEMMFISMIPPAVFMFFRDLNLFVHIRVSQLVPNNHYRLFSVRYHSFTS